MLKVSGLNAMLTGYVAGFGFEGQTFSAIKSK